MILLLIIIMLLLKRMNNCMIEAWWIVKIMELVDRFLSVLLRLSMNM